MRLGERATGRDNNFNLVRLLAAGLVLVSHSWPLTGTPGEPLERVAGFSLGHLGVDVFFVVSGFLVTGSLLARPLPSFLRARVLRIFPALALSAFGTAFVIGPLVTAKPLGAYLVAFDTWRFALQNSVTWPFGVRWFLPGAFLGNPGGPAVNGALWSLPWELTMYAMLATLGGLAAAGVRARLAPDVRGTVRVAVWLLAVLADVGFGVNEALALSTRFEIVQGLRLVGLFFTTAVLQLERDRVPLSTAGAVAALVLLTASMRFGGWGMALYPLTLGYVVLWLALVPAGPLRAYNRVGDYSYGFYLWQFPLQQWIVLRHPGLTPFGLMALAAPATLVLAALSWHLVEKRALAFKSRAGPRAPTRAA